MEKLRIEVDRCKGCGLCVEFCVKKILVLSEELNKKGFHPVSAINIEDCTGCRNCQVICPDLVITYLGDGKRIKKDQIERAG
jgi:2-oxoglutarate ferredoxin oxidoreductase subunit delta